MRATGCASVENCVEWLMGHLDDPDLNDPLPAAAATPAVASAAVAAATAADEPDSEAVATLAAMGFDERSVRAAFHATRGPPPPSGGAPGGRGAPRGGPFDAGRAADWLLSQGDGLAAAVDAALAAASAAAAAAAELVEQEEKERMEREAAEKELSSLSPLERSKRGLGDGAGRYRLVSFVTHLGSSVSGGHYICHVREETGDGWLLYNDEKVTKVDKCNSDQGYLFLFKRIDA